MLIPRRRYLQLVKHAAELKAQGSSWEQVAEKLGRPVKTIQDWRYRYREFWEQAIACARQEIAEDAGDEGLAIVRTLARSKNEKIRREAATRLLDYRKAGHTSAISPDLINFLDFLEDLSDDQLNSLLGVDLCHDIDRAQVDATEPTCPAIPE
jgi:hypothetical protein